MITIILEITSTEVADPQRIVKIIGDALEFTGEDLFDTIKILTLPTDEGIEKEPYDDEKYYNKSNGLEWNTGFRRGFIKGAKWLKSEILYP